MTGIWRRIAFTLGALAAYRLGTHIPLPGIDSQTLLELYADGIVRAGGESWKAPNWLAGLSVFSLGIIPYLMAAVLMRLGSGISSRLRALESQSPGGRQRIVRITRLLAVFIAAIQAIGMAAGIESMRYAVPDSGPAFRLGAAATMIAGFVIVMWLSDQMTLRGIGNGVALILFADVAAGLPWALAVYLELTNTGALDLETTTLLLLLSLALVAGIVFVERAVRHVHVLYPGQRVGNRTFGGQYVSMPLKLNNGGLIPAVIAAWILTHVYYLITLVIFSGEGYVNERWMLWGWYGHLDHVAAGAVLILAMAYIYAVALLDPGDIAKRLQERGAFTLDAQPGIETERAFRRLIRVLSLFGGLYLAAVYLLPEFLHGVIPALPGQIGGAGFLVAVAVAMDTLADLAHRLRRNRSGGPPSEAVAIAMDIPDRPRVSATGR